MDNVRGKRITAISVAVALLVGLVAWFSLGNGGENHPVELQIAEQAGGSGLIHYAAYQMAHKNAAKATTDRELLMDTDGGMVLLRAGEEKTWDLTVENGMLYSLQLDYETVDDNLYDYEVSLKVDGEYPYEELKNMPVKNRWRPEETTLVKGKSPELVKETGLLTAALRDRNSYYVQPLQIFLSAGTHRLTLLGGERDLGIYALRLCAVPAIPTYEEYVRGFPLSGGKTIAFEGEYADYRTSPSISELFDGTSSITSPPSVDKKTVNTIGGETFATVSDSLTWSFTVEESGAYALSMRIRQDYTGGAPVYRRMLLDDKIPFQECETLEIAYESGFKRYVPGGDSPYYFYLSKGTHTLTLEASLGKTAQVIQRASQSEEVLSDLYRRILVLTGANPDPYRDYLIEEKLPDVLEEMQQQVGVLQNLSAYLAYIGGGRSSDTAVLNNLIRQLERFVREPDSIPGQLDSFNSNKSALSTWIQEQREQPLEIDWLMFTPAEEPLPEMKETWTAKLGFQIRQFLASFTGDYATDFGSGRNTVEVWTMTGRDQVQVLQRLIEKSFTPQTGVSVRLKLVQSGTLLPAVVSGIGPDVSIMNAGADAVNFASRQAVVDVSSLPGFEEIIEQFTESAIVPLRLENGVYGLPEQQTFPILFYRKDILNELQLKVPNTWPEAYAVMVELLKNNMEFGIPTGLPGYGMFLYQNGGQLYNEDGSLCLLDSNESVSAFTQWSKLYADLGMPMSYNFVNRFRSGEMPIGVADYTMYNTLAVFAPEIYDKWDIACVPGTLKADGTLDRSVVASGTCSMLFANGERQAAAWSFMRWWCGSDAQTAYGRDIETRLGAAARYPTANRVAFANLMWTPGQLRVLREQQQYVKGAPEVPGGYFVTRHLENSFRNVVLNGREIRETLREYNTFINLEIAEKREELGIGGKSSG